MEIRFEDGNFTTLSSACLDHSKILIFLHVLLIMKTTEKGFNKLRYKLSTYEN